MTIKRIINGKPVEITLTEHEMWIAYREQEHRFDVEDVRHWLEEDEQELTDDEIDDAAFMARSWIDGNDRIGDCRWDCIGDAVRRVKE